MLKPLVMCSVLLLTQHLSSILALMSTAYPNYHNHERIDRARCLGSLDRLRQRAIVAL